MSSMIGSRGCGPTGCGNKGKVSGYNMSTVNTLSPQQQQLFDQLMNGTMPGIAGGLSHLSKLANGDQSYFEDLEKPAMRQFGEMQGQLASRFSGGGFAPGAMGARRGSGFTNTMNSATTQFAENLQSNRLNLQQQAIRDLLGMSQSLLGTQTQHSFMSPKRKPFWQELLMGMSPGIGQAAGMGFGFF